MLAALCLNFIITEAGEPRVYYPVPKYYKNSGKGSTALSPLMFLGTLPGMISHIHFPHFVSNIDFSDATRIIQDHKIMLGVATSIVFLTLLVKQLQRLQMGAWCNEKYATVSTSVNNYIDNSSFPVRIFIRFLCDVIKKYIAMNKTTIVFSVAAPVSGRLLDCVCGCPIPLLNFTSIGLLASGGIFLIGCFDSRFGKIDEKVEEVCEKLNGIEIKIDESNTNNMQQHDATQKQIGVVQRTIATVTDHVSTLCGKIKKLKVGVGQVRDQLGTVSDQVKNVFQELTGVKKQVHLLHEKIDMKDKKDTEQYEALKAQLERLQESYDQAMLLLREKAQNDENLRKELGDFKDTYQNNHEVLRNDLGLTSIRLSNQIDDVHREVQEGFAAQNRYLGQPDHRDMKIKMLQLQVNKNDANNS
jgi:chromosome segregation ATPase